MKIEEYREIYSKCKSYGLSDNVAIAILQEMGKDSRTPKGYDEKRLGIDFIQATEKQKILLKKMKVKFQENISKTDASKMIDERLKNAKAKKD